MRAQTSRASVLRVPHSGGSPRLVQLLLAVPLFLAFFAVVLRSSVGGSYDPLDADQRLDASIFSEDHLVAGLERRPVLLERATKLTGRKEVRPQGFDSPWKGPGPNPNGVKIAFCVTTSEPLADLRLWLQYNKAIGVARFYLFVQGRAALPENIAGLQHLPEVTVVPYDDKLKQTHATSRIWKEQWLAAFFHKPCNHELFVLQSLNMEEAIKLARKDDMDWILHVDTDELMYPAGSPGFSLQEVLGAVPSHVDSLVFPNYEALPEREDVLNPFLEVTLFKKNFQHIVSDLYFKNYVSVAHGNPNYFVTYANGKAAARIHPGLRPNGAHRWSSYEKSMEEWTSEVAAVLHYTYNRFSDLKGRRDRCDCAPTEEDAKRCFILPFDRLAFLESSLRDDNELKQFFRDHLLWKQDNVTTDLLHQGLLARLYEPQLLIRGFLAASATSDGSSAVPQLQPSPQSSRNPEEASAQAGDANVDAAAVKKAAMVAALERSSVEMEAGGEIAAGDPAVNSTASREEPQTGVQTELAPLQHVVAGTNVSAIVGPGDPAAVRSNTVPPSPEGGRQVEQAAHGPTASNTTGASLSQAASS
uniref:Glycosyltransferase family 92 protein n=2 Tax=Auxenochlorella protothecoides TaxID=3075 RepID=A0A1D2A8P6_AUXPR